MDAPSWYIRGDMTEYISRVLEFAELEPVLLLQRLVNLAYAKMNAKLGMKKLRKNATFHPHENHQNQHFYEFIEHNYILYTFYNLIY